MKKYTLYFHDRIEELNEIGDDDQPTGEIIMTAEDYERLLNPNLHIRFTESGKLHGDDDESRELHFECHLTFEAKDDDDAKNKITEVLNENDFEWVSVYVLLEGTLDANNFRRVYEHL